MSWQQGRGGMGSRKHGRSGRSGPPPDLKQYLVRMQNQSQRKPKRHQAWFGSVVTLLRARRT